MGIRETMSTLLPDGRRPRQQILELYSLLHPVDFVPTHPEIENLQNEFIDCSKPHLPSTSFTTQPTLAFRKIQAASGHPPSRIVHGFIVHAIL